MKHAFILRHTSKVGMTSRDSSVIDSYFNEHSLVQQQLESYNEFVRTSLLDIIETNKLLSVTATTADNRLQKNIVTFGKTYVSTPTIINPDGSSSVVLPHEARLRNLTYASSVFVDIDIKSFLSDPLPPSSCITNTTADHDLLMHPVQM